MSNSFNCEYPYLAWPCPTHPSLDQPNRVRASVSHLLPSHLARLATGGGVIHRARYGTRYRNCTCRQRSYALTVCGPLPLHSELERMNTCACSRRRRFAFRECCVSLCSHLATVPAHNNGNLHFVDVLSRYRLRPHMTALQIARNVRIMSNDLWAILFHP